MSCYEQDEKLLDTISKLLGITGETSDAVSTHTQVKMIVAPRLLRMPKDEFPEILDQDSSIWKPKVWNNVEDPVALLERNLHGHPLAGLHWDKTFEEMLF